MLIISAQYFPEQGKAIITIDGTPKNAKLDHVKLTRVHKIPIARFVLNDKHTTFDVPIDPNKLEDWKAAIKRHKPPK